MTKKSKKKRKRRFKIRGFHVLTCFPLVFAIGVLLAMGALPPSSETDWALSVFLLGFGGLFPLFALISWILGKFGIFVDSSCFPNYGSTAAGRHLIQTSGMNQSQSDGGDD